MTVSLDEYTKIVTAAYHKDITSIADPEQRAAALQPIFDFVDSQESALESSDVSLKTVVSVMTAAKNQFTNLVSNCF
jgi:hypothetical protein